MTQIELESKIKIVKQNKAAERDTILNNYNHDRGVVDKFFSKLEEDRNSYFLSWHKKRADLIDKLHEFKRAGLADFSEEVSTVNAQLGELKLEKIERNFSFDKQKKDLLDQRRKISNKMDMDLRTLSHNSSAEIRSLVATYFDGKTIENAAKTE